MNEHKKHTNVPRPHRGLFARNEWSIHGSTCDAISQFVEKISALLADKVPLTYLDASHKSEVDPDAVTRLNRVTTRPGALDLKMNSSWNDFDLKLQLSRPGICLLNGNHHLASRQLVILDERKRESLFRKKDRLSRVDLVITTDTNRQAYDFLENHMHEHTEQIDLSMPEKIADWIVKNVEPVPLNGLVLAGGRSSRMGMDKGRICYHEKDQRVHTAELLSEMCEEVFISCRADQLDEMPQAIPTVVDTFIDLGPLGAILSAFRSKPDSAWYVLACDIPLIDRAALQQLVLARDLYAHATAFAKSPDAFPEPLAAIWEPASYLRALEFLHLGYACPRKVLINSNTKVVIPDNPDILMNVNTPEEKEKLKRLLLP